MSGETKQSVQGELVLRGDKPGLRLASGKFLWLQGDDPTDGVVRDNRLHGLQLEAIGKLEPPDLFRIDPIHTKAMFIHRDSKRLFISYWCDVCSIRTYAPGICWCCQDETVLQLTESDPTDPS